MRTQFVARRVKRKRLSGHDAELGGMRMQVLLQAESLSSPCLSAGDIAKSAAAYNAAIAGQFSYDARGAPMPMKMPHVSKRDEMFLAHCHEFQLPRRASR